MTGFRNRWALSLMVALLVGVAAAPPLSRALEPPRPGEVERFRKSKEWEPRRAFARELGNHKTRPGRLIEALRKARRAALSAAGVSPETAGPLAQAYAPPPAMAGMPTRGSVKLFALLIDFPDYPHGNTQSYINTRLFGNGTPAEFPYESLAAYYQRSSYGQLFLDSGTTLGWYTTSYNRSAIPQTRQGRESLIKEAITYFQNQGHDFRPYDNDGDGTIDYFLVIWSGPDNGWGGFWWGYQTSFGDRNFTVGGKRLEDYSWQWESNPAGGPFTARVAIHETGHALGLADYYDYDDAVGPRGGVGRLDMMDGNWGDHNCFSKWILDWITPTVVASGSSLIPLSPSATLGEAVLVMPGITSDDRFAEFFMVQNRYRSGNDQTVPTDGLLIWHVDAALNASGTDFLYDNSDTAHKLLRLMEADGLEEIEQNKQANAGDFYLPGKSFGDVTTPSSVAYSGQPTRVEVGGIARAGTVFSATYAITGTLPPVKIPSAPQMSSVH
jgi:M6 family metalloprotease-like protein